MLKKNELKRYLYKKLKTKLNLKGFNKKADDFIKESDLGINTIGVDIAYYGTAGSWVNFYFSVHINCVNKIFQDFYIAKRGSADPAYIPLVASLTKLKQASHPYRKDVLTLAHADNILNDFDIDFELFIEPFLNQYSTIENIEKYINRNFNIEDEFNLIFKSQMGLVLAHITNREDFDEIYDNYIKSWKECSFNDDLKKENIIELKQLKSFLMNGKSEL